MCVGDQATTARVWNDCVLNLYRFFVATFQVQKLFHSVKSLNLGQDLYFFFENSSENRNWNDLMFPC